MPGVGEGLLRHQTWVSSRRGVPELRLKEGGALGDTGVGWGEEVLLNWLQVLWAGPWHGPLGWLSSRLPKRENSG